MVQSHRQLQLFANPNVEADYVKRYNRFPIYSPQQLFSSPEFFEKPDSLEGETGLIKNNDLSLYFGTEFIQPQLVLSNESPQHRSAWITVVSSKRFQQCESRPYLEYMVFCSPIPTHHLVKQNHTTLHHLASLNLKFTLTENAWKNTHCNSPLQGGHLCLCTLASTTAETI